MNKVVILIAILAVLAFVLRFTQADKKVPEQKSPPVLSVIP